MKLNEYQEIAKETITPNIKNNISYLTLGLTGEAGEVAEKVKKHIRDGHLDSMELMKELGDVLWYISQLAAAFGVSLEDVANMNIEKLRGRKQRGKIAGSGDNR